MSDSIGAVDKTVYSGSDYISDMMKKKDPEELTGSFSANGISTDNYGDIQSKREKEDLFGDDKAMGKDAFLQLLTTQLKYQDPLEPMSNEDFIAQMAQFSALEATQNVETAISGLDDSFHQSLTIQQESLDGLKSSNATIASSLSLQNSSSLAMNNALTTGLIGKDVRVKVDQLLMENDKTGKMSGKMLSFQTASPANDVKVKIYDSNDNLVRSIQANSMSDDFKNEEYGDNMVYFNALSDDGELLTPGVYKVEIEAYYGNSQVSSNVFEQGIVSGVDFGTNGTQLHVKSINLASKDGDEYTMTIPIDKISSVRQHDDES